MEEGRGKDKKDGVNRKWGRSEEELESALRHGGSLALKTSGPINVAVPNFLSELRRSIMLATGDNRETCFFFQCLSITLQRLNPVAFQGTLTGLDSLGRHTFFFNYMNKHRTYLCETMIAFFVINEYNQCFSSGNA